MTAFYDFSMGAIMRHFDIVALVVVCFLLLLFAVSHFMSPVMGKLIKSALCNELCPNWHLPTLSQLRRLL